MLIASSSGVMIDRFSIVASVVNYLGQYLGSFPSALSDNKIRAVVDTYSL